MPSLGAPDGGWVACPWSFPWQGPSFSMASWSMADRPLIAGVRVDGLRGPDDRGVLSADLSFRVGLRWDRIGTVRFAYDDEGDLGFWGKQPPYFGSERRTARHTILRAVLDAIEETP